MGACVAAAVEISLVLDAEEGDDDCANTGVAMIIHMTLNVMRQKAIARDMGHDIDREVSREKGGRRSPIRLIG